ncbi:MAG: EAL domain-containing protein [Spirulinaceae cyanobacterium]
MDWQLLGSRPPNQGERFQNRWWQQCLGGSVAALLTIAMHSLGLLYPLERWAYISLFRQRGPDLWDDRIVLVAIDRAAIADLEAQNWSRQPYIKLLETLALGQPRVVVLDMLLQKPTVHDAALAQALHNDFASVLAIAWNQDGDIFQSAPLLRQAAAAQGHVVKKENPDGLTRHIAPEIHETPALSLAAAELYWQKENRTPSRPATLWINWPDTVENLTSYSFKDVVEGRISPTAFQDKIVVIGTTAVGFDAVETPFDFDPPASGVHLHSALIDNLLKDNLLQPWGHDLRWTFPLYFLMGIGLSLGLGSYRWRQKVTIGAIVFLVWGIGGVASFQHNILLPLVTPSVLILSTVAIAILQDRFALDGIVEQQKALIYQQNLYDSLTGLPNRTLFMKYLRAAAHHTGPYADTTFAVLFLDLDRFKVINAHRGHQTGDILLVAIARRLQQWTTQSQSSLSGDRCRILARFGGDEFTLLLQNLTDIEDAIKAAREIDRLFLNSFHIDGQEIFSSVSIGIAWSHPISHRETLDLPALTAFDQPESILRNAEIAMYQAKVQGKARYALFNSNLHQNAIALLQLETDLRQAVGHPPHSAPPSAATRLRSVIGSRTATALNLDRQDLLLSREFRVYYQPIISLQTGKIIGFEALIRWQHPQRGLISPVEFIPLAEETGLIMILGEWVLRQACEQLAQWHQTLAGGEELMITVNLSPAQLKQPDLPQIVAKILQKTHLNSQKLKLEITESGLMENIDIALSLLQRFTKLGVQLSIDDFGIGYSSLGRLQHLPFNTLKIDQSFVRWMGFENESLEIVQTILTLAHNLGMNVVAEGVESLEQLSQLRQLQCDYGQGYLFSRPIDAIAATTLLCADPRW